MIGGGALQRTKAELRAAILLLAARCHRRARPRGAGPGDHLAALVTDAQTVCAYVPVGSEPGSLELIDSLHRRGVRVLLPVARDATGVPEPLQWGEYRPGELVGARYGLQEPAPPWLGADAIADASLILVPALAVDRAGVRLGRGAGFYDRSLPLADARQPDWSPLCATTNSSTSCPPNRTMCRMTHALTPRVG